MKGAILPGHVGQNRYKLQIVGAPELVFTEVSGLESETTVVELPDRTQASGGEEMVGEITAQHPLHHGVERAYLEAWLVAGRDPVQPGYKRPATMTWINIHGEVAGVWSIVGMFCSKRVLPDAEMGNDGEMTTIEWTFKHDSCVPLP